MSYININIFIYGCINVWGIFFGSVWGFFFALYVVPSSGFCLGVCLGNFFRPNFLGDFFRVPFVVLAVGLPNKSNIDFKMYVLVCIHVCNSVQVLL